MIRFSDLTERKSAVAVVGLGYVGLPLAVALAPHFRVIGFDISRGRIDGLRKGRDDTAEVEPSKLKKALIEYTDDPSRLSEAGAIIVAVPTPINEHRTPDLTAVTGASAMVGKHLSKGSVVVYESTVYPGLTEEVCIPLLEENSGMKSGRDFTVGYSPERINPGDKVHTLETIVKIVSGQDTATLDLLTELYGSVVKAGVHRAGSIKVAEAAKVIENTQRDLNIALMNELSLIFQRIGIDTLEVLEAAGTKWNFLPFRPGLVGGHCIGVDPYYLTFKAKSLGFHPQVILAGRTINDSMGKYVARTAIKFMIQRKCVVHDARVGILGLTFKENVPDIRNTKMIDIIREFEEYGIDPLVHDPMADPMEVEREYGLTLNPLDDFRDLDVLIMGVPHDRYKSLDSDSWSTFLRDPSRAVVMDLKGIWTAESFNSKGALYWRL
ncbi:MAG: nucleotide sugar dehydrogenase [Desulfovibrionales bacterium]